MDFDTAWCPACDKQIQPKRYLETIPPPNPTPAVALHHHKKGGLVSGTGRLRALKAQQAAAAAKAQQQQQAQPPRQRLVIDNGPIPLYCSDACHRADINSRAIESAPSSSSADSASSSGSSASPSSSTSSLGTPPKQLSSIEKFASAYNFPIPPPPPTFEAEVSPTYSSQQYTNGIMMAGKLISELCPTKPSSKSSRHPNSPREPTKVTPGWNDGTGSGAWRSSVYNFTSRPTGQTLLTRTQSAQSPARRRTPSAGPSSSCMSAPPTHPSPLESSELIAKFNDKFTKRCEARMTHSATSSTPTSTPTPISPCSPPTRERPLVHSTAQGKLLVPDVKLKVRTGSSASLSSMRSASRTPLSAPAMTLTSATGSSSRKSSASRSIRSPLGVEQDERLATSFTLRRPTIETRSWSYDNVPTYPIMQLPPTKIMRRQRRIVDGEEIEEDVEVEVKEERKRLFLFADKMVCKV